MDELLNQLIREIVTHPDRTQKQEQAMNQLLQLIPNLKNIYKPPNLPDNYEDALNEALTSISMYQNRRSGYRIRRFYDTRCLDEIDNVIKIRRDFVNWFNRILKNQIVEQWRKKYKISSRDKPQKYRNKQPFSLETPLTTDNTTSFKDILPDPTLSGITKIIDEEDRRQQQKQYTAILNYLIRDPDNLLHDCCPHNYPHSNCHELLKLRFLAKNKSTWQEIAQRLQIPYGTVTSHWKRKCQAKVFPKIIDKLKNLD